MVGGQSHSSQSGGMSGLRKSSAASLAAALLVAAGCGSGGATETSKDPLATYPKGPTRQFIAPGADNTVQEFGREATAAERNQVSRMVEAWLRARVMGHWGEVCSYLHRKNAAYAIVTGSEVTGKKLTSCARGLAALTRYSGEAPRDNIKGGVASLRIEAGHGFAQYHGKEGRDWVLPVRREDGNWKISDLYPIERFK
jgi:hypothetical protein